MQSPPDPDEYEVFADDEVPSPQMDQISFDRGVVVGLMVALGLVMMGYVVRLLFL